MKARWYYGMSWFSSGVLAVVMGCTSETGSNDRDTGDTSSGIDTASSEDDTSEADTASGIGSESGEEGETDTETEMSADTESAGEGGNDTDTATETSWETDTATEPSWETDTEMDAGPDDVNKGDFDVGDFSYEDPEPTGYHPLGVARQNFIRREETAFVVGRNAADSWWEDDAQQGGASFPLELGLPEGSTPILAMAGDLDGEDGAELIVVGHSREALTVAVIDGDRDTVLSVTRGFSITDAGTNAGAVRLTLGDFDGDERDELALSNGRWLRVYDDAVKDFSLIDELFEDADFSDVDIAAGNFDDDGAFELALLHVGPGLDTPGIVIYDDAGEGFAEKKTYGPAQLLPTHQDGTSEWESGGMLAVGNVDNDVQDELYALFVHMDLGGEGGTQVLSWVFDDAAGSGTVLDAMDRSLEIDPPRQNLARPIALLFADLNGDGYDELCEAYQDPTAEHGWMLDIHNFAQGARISLTDGFAFTPTFDSEMMLRMAAVDGDRLVGESIVAAFGRSGESVQTIRLGANYKTTSDNTDEAVVVEVSEGPSTHEQTVTRVPLVVGGDFDGDSFQIRYTGQHWLSLPSPRPVIVMAAPPLRAGIQNEAFSETAYGTAVSRGESETHEIETTNATTTSFETSALTGFMDDLAGLLGASFSKTMANTLSLAGTKTELSTFTTSYAGAYPDDYVVFLGVLHHVYAYEVVTADDSEILGKRMTIDVPVAVKTYKWTLSYFNDIVEPELRIGPETLDHQSGDPASYPTPEDRTALLNHFGGWRTKTVTVGQGGGVNTATLELEVEGADLAARTITNDASYGLSVAGAGYDSSRSVSDSHVFVSIAGKSTSYEGTVGDIADPANYARYAYDFEMFVYNFEQPNGRRFQVINYATSNLGPGYAE